MLDLDQDHHRHRGYEPELLHAGSFVPSAEQARRQNHTIEPIAHCITLLRSMVTGCAHPGVKDTNDQNPGFDLETDDHIRPMLEVPQPCPESFDAPAGSQVLGKIPEAQPKLIAIATRLLDAEDLGVVAYGFGARPRR